MAIDDETRNKRLWADTGTNSTVLPATTDDEDVLSIEDVFTEAAEEYADNEAKQTAYARVIVFRRLLAPSAFQGKYVQNQSEEDLEKIFDNLEQLLDRWEKRVAVVTDALPEGTTITGIFFGVAPGYRGR